MADISEFFANLEQQKSGQDNKRDSMYRIQAMRAEAEKIKKEIAELNGEAFSNSILADSTGVTEEQKEKHLAAERIANEKRMELEDRLKLINDTLEGLEGEFCMNKSFDKFLCFSNIRELLRKNPDVKLGQIEKDAGCQPGYMSRLEKSTNTSEPTVEFIVTAAKAFGIGIDTLIRADLARMTPTELYLVSFLQKMVSDTVADKLDWKKEAAEYLNRLGLDRNGNADHPLFSYETFYTEGETEYPDQVSDVVFTSNAYGVCTSIYGDCFNLRLKNGATVYLMDISKRAYKVGDPNAYTKEIWIHTPGAGSSFLVDNRNRTALGELVEILFTIVSETMSHPHIRKEHLYAIDAFMKDDLEDDSPF